MNTRKLLLIFVSVSLLFLLTACAIFLEEEEPLSPEEDPPFYFGEAPHFGPDMQNVRLVSIWDDTMYFIYTEREEWPSGSLQNWDNRLARMQTDGSGLQVFWEGETYEGTAEDGRRYFIGQSVQIATGLPGGGIAAVIRTSGHYEYHIPYGLPPQSNFTGDFSPVQLLSSPPLVTEHRLELYWDLLVFSPEGEVLAEHDFRDFWNLPPDPAYFLWLLGMESLSDGRIVLGTERDFYIFDPSGEGALTHLTAPGNLGMRISGFTVLTGDEIVALLIHDVHWYLEKVQLWRICTQSGAHRVASEETGASIIDQTLRPGGTFDLYMQACCTPGGEPYEFGSGVVGIDLETGDRVLLFEWSDFELYRWSPFRTCNRGQIYALRPLWDEFPFSLLGTELERIVLDFSIPHRAWYCTCRMSREQRARDSIFEGLDSEDALHWANAQLFDLAQAAARNLDGAEYVEVRQPLMLDENAVYYLVSGWFHYREWREQVFPLCLETFSFLPPIFSRDSGILAGQTGLSRSGTFWLAELCDERRLTFLEINTEGAVLQNLSIDEETVHAVLGAGIPLLDGGWLSVNAFHFAVLEAGIVIHYFAKDIDMYMPSVLGLLTFEGQLQRLDLPGQASRFHFYDSRANGLIVWIDDAVGYSDSFLFRLDGSTLEWIDVFVSEGGL